MKAKVFIATPAFGGQVAIQYVGSLLGAISALNKAGIECIVSLVHGGPYIVSERNHAVRRFLETDCTHLFFIDADLGFDPNAALRMLQRNVEIIAGLYPLKEKGEEAYAARILNQENGTPSVLPNGLVETDGVPTGFMLIQRQVIVDMINRYPGLAYKDKDLPMYALFDCQLAGGRWWGEDYVFCRRWIQMGGRVYAEPNITFVHCGSRVWEGNWHEFMLRQPGGSNHPDTLKEVL